MEYQTIRLEAEAPLARLVLARPQDANRIDQRLLRELQDACDSVAADDAMRAVLLTAQGDDFCAGWAADTGDPGFAIPFDAFGCLASLPQPVVCALQGKVAGAGLELALAADIRVCERGAKFSTADSWRGLFPQAGGGQRLARLAGRGTAAAMLLTGEDLDAQGAYRTGLVSRVVKISDLVKSAEAIAASIVEKGPIATRYAKEAVRRGLDMTLDQAMRYETDLTIILQTTEDRAEGVRAFAEKRKPRFKGS